MKYQKDMHENIKVRLIAEQEKTQETLASLVAQDPYSDPDRLNDNAASDTEASEESSHERMEALRKELTAHLQEITDALTKIEDGTYGLCRSCGNPIESGRLAVKPTALFCLSCEQKKEK